MNMITCEACRANKVFLVTTKAPTKRYFGRCFKCGLLQNIDKKLPSQIEGEDFEGYLEAQDETFEKIRRTSVLLRIRQILFQNEMELSVYDIGTGAGKFLMEASEMGFTVSGSELSFTAAAIVENNYGFRIDTGDYENLGFKNCQNSVTMFCVLAHSVNPESLLKSINQSLKKGGVLYFHTPRFCLIDFIAILINFISFGKLNQLLIRRIGGDHKRIYSKKSLTYVLRRAGFSEYTISPDIGYGLNKDRYFTAMGMPKKFSDAIAYVLNFFAKFNLLPRNVFTVYAFKAK